jgi:Zn-dependent peptidase ImmA (M78 family)
MTRRSITARDAESRAEELISEQRIKAAPVPVEDMCERLGLDIICEALPYDTSSVLIRQPNGRRVIGVNARHAPRRRRFSVAHELGHALLHFPEGPPRGGEAAVSRPLEVLFRDGLAGQGTDRVEIAANAFAAALLMPAELVRARLRKRWQQDVTVRVDDIIAALADDFEVSEQAMRYRLVNLGLIDPA